MSTKLCNRIRVPFVHSTTNTTPFKSCFAEPRIQKKKKKSVLNTPLNTDPRVNKDPAQALKFSFLKVGLSLAPPESRTSGNK